MLETSERQMAAAKATRYDRGAQLLHRWSQCCNPSFQSSLAHQPTNPLARSTSPLSERSGRDDLSSAAALRQTGRFADDAVHADDTSSTTKYMACIKMCIEALDHKEAGSGSQMLRLMLHLTLVGCHVRAAEAPEKRSRAANMVVQC